jgi:hypothetical protein
VNLPWPPGPWDEEPEELRWLTDAGLPAVIRRLTLGALAGYVGVKPTHPLHGRGRLDDADVGSIRVHGGVTWARAFLPDEPPDAEGRWWFGFDCSHAWDLIPALAGVMASAHAKTLARFPGARR